MTIKINDLVGWSNLRPDQVLDLDGDKEQPRRIRIEFNAPKHTEVWAAEGYGTPAQEEPVFVAAFSGYETVEFTATGKVQVQVLSDELVFFRTSDGMEIGVEDADEASFVKMLERRTEAAEAILARDRIISNFERLFQQQADEIAAMHRLDAFNPETGEVNEQPTASNPAPVPASAEQPVTQPAANAPSASVAPGAAPAPGGANEPAPAA